MADKKGGCCGQAGVFSTTQHSQQSIRYLALLTGKDEAALKMEKSEHEA